VWQIGRALSRNIIGADEYVRSGESWLGADRLAGLELRNKTAAVIGAGRIGCEVARILVAGFGMRVVLYDYRARRIDLLSTYQLDVTADLAEAVGSADFVTIHLPLNEKTRGLFDAKLLAQVRPGAFLINTSRGEVVDECALLTRLNEGHISGAALDVFADEPILPDSPLLKNGRLILTPHLAAYTREAFSSMGEVVYDVVNVLEGRGTRWEV